MEKIRHGELPASQLLKPGEGGGTQIALTFVLTFGNPQSVPKGREVGCFFLGFGALAHGLRRGASRILHLSKEGDTY